MYSIGWFLCFGNGSEWIFVFDVVLDCIEVVCEVLLICFIYSYEGKDVEVVVFFNFFGSGEGCFLMFFWIISIWFGIYGILKFNDG